MKKSSSSESAKQDRKTVERNRRMKMKGLCFKLASLIPSQHYVKSSSKDTMLSQQDQIDQAAAYIKLLRERIEELKVKKELAKTLMNNSIDEGVAAADGRACCPPPSSSGMALPTFEIRDWDSGLEVMLIGGVNNKNFMLYEVISILEEEGAQVVSASISTIGDKVFHSVHAQVRISRVGVDTARVCERLQELVYPF